MRKFGLIGFIALAACQPISSPSTIANATTVDEKVSIEAETAYSTFALAADLATKAGFLHGDNARQVADIDNKLYAAIQIERSAYRAGNSADWNSAIAQINTLVVQGLNIINTAKGN